jgi:murein peptide amidase A
VKRQDPSLSSSRRSYRLRRTIDVILTTLLTTLIVLIAVVVVAIAALIAAEQQGRPIHLPAVFTELPRAAVTGSSSRTADVTWRLIGRSVQGRPIRAASFGSGTRRVLFLGGVHGSEYGSDVAEQFASYLAGNPNVIPRGTQIDVIGCLNPDGRALGRRGNAHLVDLNRNLPTRNWIPVHTRGDTAGPRPASEPENQALLTYLQRGYVRVISLHSQGGIVDYDGPGGRALATRVSEASGMPVMHLAGTHVYSGTLGSYVPERYGVPLVTVELAYPYLSSEVCAGLVAAMR